METGKWPFQWLVISGQWSGVNDWWSLSVVDGSLIGLLTLIDICFFYPKVMGHEGQSHNLVVIALITKFGIDIKLDVFYTMVTKNCDVLLTCRPKFQMLVTPKPLD